MRVICTLPHCSSPINGWSFESTPTGWVSEDLPVDVAQRFLTIPGYTLVRSVPDPEDAPAPAPVLTPRRGRPPRTPV